MSELQQAVVAAFDRISASGMIEKAIEEKVGATVQDAIERELRSHSDFGKQVQEHVRAALQVDFSTLGLPGYSELILKIVRRQVDAHVNNALAEHVEEQMVDLLAPAPAEIALTTLVAEFIKDKTEYSGCSCDGPDRITLIVEDSGSVQGYHHVYMDAEPRKSKYECGIQIAVNDASKVYSLMIGRANAEKSLFIGPLFGFERRLFQMYAAGTKLIVDGGPDDIDTHYPGRNY
jgi:hypothetical protein